MVKAQLLINGKVYLSSRRVAEIAGYSTDYVGQLCRESRVKSHMIRGKWYVEEESLSEYQNEISRVNETSFTSQENSQDKTSGNLSSVKVKTPSFRPSYKSINHFGSLAFAALMFALSFNAGTTFMQSGIAPHLGAVISRVADHSYRYVGAVISSANGNDGDVSNAASAGLVVVPATDSAKQNSEIAQSIANSFSDPVVVHQTQANAGTITPVFRSVQGHDYIYVLVPVQATTTTMNTTKNK